MMLLYEAENTIEAHLIKGMLEQAGLVCYIHGEYLQGGIGELQAFGLIRVMIAEQDYEAGRVIIDDWQSSEVVHKFF